MAQGGVDAGRGSDAEHHASASVRAEDAAPSATSYCKKDTVGRTREAEGVGGDNATGGSVFQGAEMRAEYIFPTVLIALDVCAAVPYAVRGNLRMMVYWLVAATLTACVTYTGSATK